jgi:membrane AbrB-like protein
MFSHLFIRRILGGFAALMGAIIALEFNIPLPWLLGPLFTVGALRLAMAPVASIKPFQFLGQYIIGITLGLYFSPEIVAIISVYWIPIMISMLLPIILGVMGAWILIKVGGVDIKTGWFAAAIGGANEMSQLAERHGGRVDLVASAHSLRILAVVIVLPFGYQALGVSGTDSTLLGKQIIDYGGLLIVAVPAALTGFWFYKNRVPNAWVLGSLMCAIALTVTGVISTSIPSWVVNLGQLLIGWALGDRYRPAFFKAAPRFLTGVAIYTLGALIVCGLIGWGLANNSELPLATVMLGVAPGGLAEMAITAQVLMLGVPLVVAFQVTRMVFVVLVTGPIYVRFLKSKDVV